MTGIVIDAERAVDELRLVVAVRGAATVYRVPTGVGASVYVHRGVPVCLVGCALHRAGVPMAVLERFGDGCIDEVGLPDGLRLTEGAIRVLAAAQRGQDNGESWGQALRHAEAELADLRGSGRW